MGLPFSLFLPPTPSLSFFSSQIFIEHLLSTGCLDKISLVPGPVVFIWYSGKTDHQQINIQVIACGEKFFERATQLIRWG